MIRILLFFAICFLHSLIGHGQHRDEIYRIAGTKYSSAMKTYNVNILILNSDNSYDLMRQQYNSKREMKKNVLLDLSTEKGKWKKEQDTLYLKSSHNKATKFFVLNKKKIALVIEDVEISPAKWKKVNSK